MDDDFPEIDALVDVIAPETDVAAGSSQAAPEQAAPPPVEAPPVAPVETETPTASSHGEPPPTPSPDLTDRLAALEAQLVQTQQKAQRLDAIESQFAEHQARQQREAQVAEWQKRLNATEDLPAEYAQRERAAVLQEVEYARNREAQQAIGQRDQEAEGAAAIAAAALQFIQNDPSRSAEQKQQAIREIQYLSQLANPQAQTATLERDQRIRAEAVAAAQAEWKRQHQTTTATKVQERIRSGADAAIPGGGSAGRVDDGSVDAVVDSIFG